MHRMSGKHINFDSERFRVPLIGDLIVSPRPTPHTHYETITLGRLRNDLLALVDDNLVFTASESSL